MDKEILIQMAGSPDLVCESVVLIPDIAIDEPGYIKAYTIKDSANAKHEYHAMAQMAYFQYQDDELEIIEVDVPLRIKTAIEEISLESGMVLARKPDGEFKVIVHGMQNKKKLLEAGYRYCTRWVRLDI
jgi:hypothetical protein